MTELHSEDTLPKPPDQQSNRPEDKASNRLTRNEELQLTLVVNLGNHYMALKKPLLTVYRTENDDTPSSSGITVEDITGTVRNLQAALEIETPLIKILESHWSVRFNSPMPINTIHHLLENEISEVLLTDIAKALSCSKSEAESRIDNTVLSLALLSRFIPGSEVEPSEISYSLDDERKLRAEYRRYFARLQNLYDEAKTKLSLANIGILINKTSETLNRDDTYVSQRNIGIIGQYIESFFLINDDPGQFADQENASIGETESDRHYHVKLECANAAMLGLQEAINKFRYRRGYNQPANVDHPFLAYASPWIDRAIKKKLVSEHTVAKPLVQLPEENFTSNVEDPEYRFQLKMYQDTIDGITQSPKGIGGISDARQSHQNNLAGNILRLTQREQKFLAYKQAVPNITLKEISFQMGLSVQQLSNLFISIQFKFRHHFGSPRDPIEWFRAIPEDIKKSIPEDQYEMLSYRFVKGYKYDQIASEINRKYDSKKWNRRAVSERIEAWVGRIRRAKQANPPT